MDSVTNKAYRIKDSGRSSSTPSSLGGYPVMGVIADRGVSQILRLWDARGGRELVGKMITPMGMRSRKMLRSLRNEAKIGQRLVHPNLVKVIKLQATGDRPYLIMEYWEGESLDMMTPEEFARVDLKSVFLAATECLAYVHREGIIHRDMKPAHLMVKPPGELRLIDFSVAHEITGKWWLLGRQRDRTAGTPEYMAPEQTLGHDQDARTDIYGLGATFFTLLTGQKPFMGKDLAGLMEQQRTAKPPRPRQANPRIRVWAEDLILAMMAKRPHDRPASMEEVAKIMRSNGPLYTAN